MPPSTGLAPFWLRDRDSNPDRLIQSQVSYRWTIPQQRGEYTTAAQAAQIAACGSVVSIHIVNLTDLRRLRTIHPCRCEMAC